LPTATRTPWRHAVATVGTQRSPVRRGALDAVCPAAARPVGASTNASAQTSVATRTFIVGKNPAARRM
jgi:hypothetical protein